MTYTTGGQAIDGAEVLGQTQAYEKGGGKKRVLHCSCCAGDVDLMNLMLWRCDSYKLFKSEEPR